MDDIRQLAQILVLKAGQRRIWSEVGMRGLQADTTQPSALNQAEQQQQTEKWAVLGNHRLRATNINRAYIFLDASVSPRVSAHLA